MKIIFPGLLFFLFIVFAACNNEGNKTLQKNGTSKINKDSAKMQDNTGMQKEATPEPDYWLNDSILLRTTRQMLDTLASVSELTRTWIQNSPGTKLPKMLENVWPNATYRTTLLRITEWPNQRETNVEVEVRRFGRLLLGFAIGADKLPHVIPGWIGYDAAGKNADQIDGFYSALKLSDSSTLSVGKQVLALFPQDMEFRTYIATAAKKLGDKVMVDSLKTNLMKEKGGTVGIDKLFVKALKTSNFGMIKGIRDVTAYRLSFGRLIRRL